MSFCFFEWQEKMEARIKLFIEILVVWFWENTEGNIDIWKLARAKDKNTDIGSTTISFTQILIEIPTLIT